MNMKWIVSAALLLIFAFLVFYFFTHHNKITPNVVKESNNSYSIVKFVVKPVCYLQVTKNDMPAENAGLGDVAFIELIYVDKDKITGRYDYLPAEKDRKIGTISSYSVEKFYPDRESYLIKALYEYDGEGDHHRDQQFFMLINGEIRIATGEMKLDKDGKTYIYADPEAIKWTDAYPRSDCKTALRTVKQQESMFY